jgi:hypothetical protein
MPIYQNHIFSFPEYLDFDLFIFIIISIVFSDFSFTTFVSLLRITALISVSINT